MKLNMFKPLGKNLLIEIKAENQSVEFIEFDREGNKKKSLSHAIVKDKGESCRNNYNIGDEIIFIAEQEYIINKNLALLLDDDVLGVENGK